MTTAAVLGQAVLGQSVFGNYTDESGGGPVLGSTAWTFTRDPAAPNRMPRQSIERIGYMVRALTAGTPVDPSAGTVQFAFTAGPPPVNGDWKAGTWETLTGPPVQYAARCLVGPGQTADIGRGFWIVWVRITDSPGVPVRAIGTLTIT